MTTVTVSSKFQVLIPCDVRNALGISRGQRIQLIALEDRIVLIPVKPASALRGFVQGIDIRLRRERDRT